VTSLPPDEGERVHAANLEKVDHVVVMMLENRSFDHMLGYQPEDRQLPRRRRPRHPAVGVLDRPGVHQLQPARLPRQRRSPAGRHRGWPGPRSRRLRRSVRARRLHSARGWHRNASNHSPDAVPGFSGSAPIS